MEWTVGRPANPDAPHHNLLAPADGLLIWAVRNGAEAPPEGDE